MAAYVLSFLTSYWRVKLLSEIFYPILQYHSSLKVQIHHNYWSLIDGTIETWRRRYSSDAALWASHANGSERVVSLPLWDVGVQKKKPIDRLMHWLIGETRWLPAHYSCRVNPMFRPRPRLAWPSPAAPARDGGPQGAMGGRGASQVKLALLCPGCS